MEQKEQKHPAIVRKNCNPLTTHPRKDLSPKKEKFFTNARISKNTLGRITRKAIHKE